jgi:hypothetical protein
MNHGGFGPLFLDRYGLLTVPLRMRFILLR